jgi:hypothetical protein
MYLKDLHAESELAPSNTVPSVFLKLTIRNMTMDMTMSLTACAGKKSRNQD